MGRNSKRLGAAELTFRWERDHSVAEDGNEEALDFDPFELNEFLAGDLMPPKASPAFKERLRDQLWTIVEARAAARQPRGPGSGGRGGSA